MTPAYLPKFCVLCGWVIGALSSPLNIRETQNFGKYAGVIAAFVSGYLFTKFDRVILEISENVLTNPVYGLRTLIFVSCLISGVLIMYIQRAYLQRQDEARKKI